MSKLNKLEIVINNYDNHTMADDPQEETIRLLNECIERIKTDSIESFEYGFYLRDINGNKVGCIKAELDYTEQEEEN